ncbi:hypothetical protein B0H66DRAFT_561104 [Apodospora peruviana]|uniref:Zinc finger Mcm10/DnaG-type domain-containing protein n=1 Tax=Apodospora peruviana TaxID=516989 RepID=A0AAE0M3A8_9PEZI|nr:hypothetical protein B0H66DRAFT_561104 [Apodospora peruviana]
MAAQWPPRSPYEALLSTPGGRERMRRMTERQSPSPSPSKLPRATSSLASRSGGKGLVMDLPDPFQEDEDDEDDDEEMLELKLQAIQAKMKLKKLQAAKAQKKAASASDSESTRRRPEPVVTETGSMRGLVIQSKLAAARDRMEQRPTQAAVQVPASPVRKAPSTTNLQTTSPQRVLLGIDKGRKAAEMSLRQAPSLRKASEDGAGQQQGGYLRRAKTPTVPAEAPRPMSFNERLASVRAEEATRQEKQQRIQQIRTKAFAVDKEEMETYKAKAVNLPDIPYQAPEYSRDDILAGKTLGGGLRRSNTVPTLRLPERETGFSATNKTANSTDQPPGTSEAAFEPYSGLHLSKRILPHKVITRAISGKKTYLIKDLLREVKAPNFSLPDVESDIVVFAIIASKSDPRSHRPGPNSVKEATGTKDRGKYMVITLVDLSYEIELFLFSSGFDRFWKLTPGTVLAILNPTIMPPPPGREDTGRFGLVINSDADTILELGNARDLGYCKSIKKDGKMCDAWVNIRRSEHCEFHTNEAVRKAREGRIELNGTFLGGPANGYKKNSREIKVKSEEERKRGEFDWETRTRFFVSGAGHHRGTASEMMDKDNNIVDRVEREEGLKRRMTQKEKERNIAKKLGEIGGSAGKEYMSRAASAATVTSERSARTTTGLGSSISSAGGGGGTSSSATTTTTGLSSLSSLSNLSYGGDPQLPGQGRRWDARALGLVGGKQQHKVELGPISKRKRPESSASNSTTGSTSMVSKGGTMGTMGNKGAAFGWGTALKDKLGRMKDGERLDGVRHHQTDDSPSAVSSSAATAPSLPPPTKARNDRSPVRKKTRFVTEKGIRIAGRESLGEPLSHAAAAVAAATAAAKRGGRQVVLLDDDDDDDDLIVLKK